MPKSSGNTRIIRPTSGTREENKKIFEYQTSMDDVSEVYSYFSESSGAYLLSMSTRKYDQTEQAAFKHLADNGYVVVATPEGGDMFISKTEANGTNKYGDGLISGTLMELKTPEPEYLRASTHKKELDKLNNSIKKALGHCREKNADIAVIFDKNGIYHREHIEAGIKDYENKNTHRFKAILIIDENGKVYEHIHNK